MASSSPVAPTSTSPQPEPRFTRNRPSRGKGLRKKTGCLTCRRRHVKCNEAKPTCSGCAKRKTSCVYETQGHANDNVPSPASTAKAWRIVRKPDELGQSRQGGHVNGISELETTSCAAIPGFSAGSSSSSSHGVDTPSARWLGLLIGDAVLNHGDLTETDFAEGRLGIFGNSPMQTPAHIVGSNPPTPVQVKHSSMHFGASQSSNASLQERLPRLGRDQISEKQAWHSEEPIKLTPPECKIFQHFVKNISQWIDLFEPKKPFGTFVPHLAMHSFGLINAILALSSRHLSLETSLSHHCLGLNRPDPSDAIGYYYKTLHYSQEAMQYDTYKVSLELLAISLIISTYEMLDGSSTDWERHLKGVFWIQRSQVIHGDSGGLRQGVWWAWLCQDVWAAFREQRKPLTFWRPTRSFDALDPWELAARSVYLFSQAVCFCSKEEMEEDKNDLSLRESKADCLMKKWAEWKHYLTVEFEALPAPADIEEPFQPIWVNPPVFGVALQLYYCAMILINLHRPGTGGIGGFLEQKSLLRRCILSVCGISMTLADYASSVMSSQCIFIAGMSVEEASQRKSILQLLDDCRQRSGWPVKPLGDELSQIWECFDKSSA